MQRILIVEDEPDIQDMLVAYLQNAGYETAIAGDGVEALSLFNWILSYKSREAASCYI